MRVNDWIDVVGAQSLGIRPLAARSRKTEPYGPPSGVQHVQFPYRQWDGPKLTWAEDFGKGRGQVYSLDGSDPVRSCNEVEVAKRLWRVREQAFWFSGYNPTAVPGLWR